MISTDMWEQINAAYHIVLDAARSQKREIYNNPYDFCRQLRTGSTLFGGLAHDTMIHGEALQFFRLGRLLQSGMNEIDVDIHGEYFSREPAPPAFGFRPNAKRALLGS